MRKKLSKVINKKIRWINKKKKIEETNVANINRKKRGKHF